MVTNQFAACIKLRDSDNIVPNSGVGGFAPIPKKPKVASSKIALEIPIVICTISGARQFGKITINIKRNTLAPATREEVT